MNKKPTLLNVENLQIQFGHDISAPKAVKGLSFSLREGEVLAVVGESGSGKTISCLSLLQLLDAESANIQSDTTSFKGTEIGYNKMSLSDIRKYRGNDIAMIFQEPMSSFNPSMRLGRQVMEAYLIHNEGEKKQAEELALQLFGKVKLPDPARIFNAYPHEVSGGQLQRVMIAMALINKPKIILADEPTTALDVTVQHEILKLLIDLKNELNLSIIFITHDLSLVRKISDRVIVMKKGQIVEQGPVEEVFRSPKDNYTKGLLACIPTLQTKTRRLPTVEMYESTADQETYLHGEKQEKRSFDATVTPAIIEAQSVSKSFAQRKQWFWQKSTKNIAVDKVSFKLHKGQILGIVGESGSGKTTLSKLVMGILKPSHGAVLFDGKDISSFNNKERKSYYKQIQYIFQNPYASLNPKMTIGAIVKEPMIVYGICTKKEATSSVNALLEEVGLSADYFNRYPSELSGGQRQRVVIARALAIKPQMLICDECVSALDVSVQATIINLLLDLREKYNLSYLFISHDLAVVKYISDQILVMNQGRVEEIIDAALIDKAAKSDYTKQLISSITEEI